VNLTALERSARKLFARGSPARWMLSLLAAVLLVRLATLGTYPLTDTSEARYGEIARVMRDTGNWVTPQETAGTPFWAKPPLYAWLCVASSTLFGMNEFALRLPSLLCGLGVLVLCGLWTMALARRAATASAPVAALLACLILSTTGFFIGYGAVMTDPALGLCTAWMMVAFQRTVIDGSERAIWRYGFFVAAGLAMLAKGPVAFLYVALPIAVWAFWRRQWKPVWRALPWVTGTLVFAAIALPWYVWAEQRTPGFLNYFLVGEHVMRFLEPGWSGDRYGNAHREPLGTIWAYLAAALGLWSVAALTLLQPAPAWRQQVLAWLQDDGRLFALLAALAPLLVFTFAGNLIWTYVLPALVPLAALLGLELAQRLAQPGSWRDGVRALAYGSAAVVCLGAMLWAPVRANGSSFAHPVSVWRKQALTKPGTLLYWGARTPASLRFYSRGAAQAAPDLNTQLARLDPGSSAYVALVPEQLPALRQLILAQSPAYELVPVDQVKHALIVRVARAAGSTRPEPFGH